MSITLYRVLLTASIVIGFLSGIIDYIFPELMAEDFRQAQSAQDQSFSTARIVALAGSGIALLVLLIPGLYGLYKFRPWAPRLAMISTVIALVFSVISGVFAQSGIALALAYLSSYLWGAVLFLVYSSPLRERFKSIDKGAGHIGN